MKRIWIGKSGRVYSKFLVCTVWGNAALCLCGGRRAAGYFFESSILLASVDAARAFALLAEEVDLEQFFAVCQNMHKLLSKRRCLSCWVSLPSFPNLSVRGLVGGLDLSFLLPLLLLLEPEPFDWFLLELLELLVLLELLSFLSDLFPELVFVTISLYLISSSYLFHLISIISNLMTQPWLILRSLHSSVPYVTHILLFITMTHFRTIYNSFPLSIKTQ